MKNVTVYSRSGCHLCEIAIDRINSVKKDYEFSLEISLIDNNNELDILRADALRNEATIASLRGLLENRPTDET